jgi:hypothetical protein
MEKRGVGPTSRFGRGGEKKNVVPAGNQTSVPLGPKSI